MDSVARGPFIEFNKRFKLFGDFHRFRSTLPLRFTANYHLREITTYIRSCIIDTVLKVGIVEVVGTAYGDGGKGNGLYPRDGFRVVRAILKVAL